MSKVKINKVVPYEEYPNAKNPPLMINQRKFVIAPTRLQQNYAGYPIFLYFAITLPESNHDYEYLKIIKQIKAENAEFRNLVNKKQETFQAVKRGNLKREILFQWIPTTKGNYTISVQCFYRAQFFVQSSQPPPQKKDTTNIPIKCEEPFQIKQSILTEDKTHSVTFPLFLQYSIESRLPNRQLICDIQFTSEKFKFKELHNERKLKLKKQETYYLMLEIEPKVLKDIIGIKGITLGTLKIQYGNKGQFAKKTSLEPQNKYVFFKANTITKQVPKKDIAEVSAVFSKIYNVNFGLKNLKLVINQSQMPEVKILKTSVDSLNLDNLKQVRVIFTVICLKSGPVHLKGIYLQSGQDTNESSSSTVYFINELSLNVGIEPQRKTQAFFQNTAQINIDSLL